MSLATPKIQSQRSPADELRAWLANAERAIVASRTSPQDAVAVIRLSDQITERVRELKAGRIDLRPEESRIESLRARLLREARPIARQVDASGQTAELTDSPTWRQVQDTASAELRSRNRRYATIGSIVGVLALLLFVVLPWLFPVTPTANTTSLSQLAGEGQFDEALTRAQAEQQRVPSDPDIWVWLGALYQQQGRPADAEAAWQTARTLMDDVNFYNTRGIVLLQTNNFTGAEADAQELIKRTDFAANGYYLLGQAQSRQNKLPEALASFQQAATIAEQSDNATIVVAAKLEIQNLMQRGPAFPSTPTP